MKAFRFLYSEISSHIRNNPLIEKISVYPIGKRFLTDIVFRTKLSLRLGLTINLLYAVLQLVIGMLYRSVWSGALAVYYILLAVMRFQLLDPANKSSADKDMVSELRKYRLCGVILLLMTPIFASILILVVHKNSGAEYPGFMLYFMAAYTLCFIIIAIAGLVRSREYQSPVVSAARVINLAVALVSVLSLETAVSARAGNNEDSIFLKYIINTTCGAICLTVLSMAVVMIVQGKKQLKIFTYENQERKGDENL